MPISRFPHLAARIFNTPLLIDEAKLNTILGVLGPRFQGVAAANEIKPSAKLIGQQNPVNQGVAIISVVGTLVNRKGGIEAESGLTSYQEIVNAISAAISDTRVASIILDVDSPGGEAEGCQEASKAIFDMRGAKPIYAVANSTMASAAYSIASAADKIFIAKETSIVGSIGVMLVHLDHSQADLKDGLKYEMIYAGQHKADLYPYKPLNDAGRDLLTRIVAAHYDDFVSAVARNRGMDDAKVRGTEAACFLGSDAIDAGLADGVASIDELIADLASGRVPAAATQTISKLSTITKETTMSDNQKPTLNPTPAAEAAATANPAAPALSSTPNAADAAAVTQAVESERDRVSGIYASCANLGLSRAHADALVKQNVSLEKANAHLITLAAEASPLKDIRSSHKSETQADEDKDSPVEDRCKAKWDKDAKLRAEFRGNFNAFLAFTKADENGQIKILNRTK